MSRTIDSRWNETINNQQANFTHSHEFLIFIIMDLFLFSASTLAGIGYWRWWHPSASSRSGCYNFDDDYSASTSKEELALRRALQDGTSLNANERVCWVTADNQEIVGGVGITRAEMRLHNLWHRATYVLVIHDPKFILPVDDITSRTLEETFVLVQRRSARKDYCPRKLDPLPGGVVEYGESYRDNAVREMQEEMGIDLSNRSNNHSNKNTLSHLFTFPYQDHRVRVWGDVYECLYRGSMEALVLQEEEVESIARLSLHELQQRLATDPDDFLPDACHALKLYFQRLGDVRVHRRMMLQRKFSSSLDCYQLRPRPKVIFFDVDDCLYFDGWKTAQKLTAKIDDWCTQQCGLAPGYAYQLYKKYGTALRGLRAEGWIEDTPEAVDEFLQYVHDIGVETLIQPDQELREILLRVDPDIPKYAFTASVREHALRCLQALGIADLFVDIIDCQTCNLETKHSRHSFETAMRVAGVADPEHCLFFDDNLTNIEAARNIGWRSVLVGRVGRDCGQPISSEHAELELDRIHQVEEALPELFGPAESM